MKNRLYYWTGFLASGFGNGGEVFIRHFRECLEEKQLPKTTLKEVTVNMWWQERKAMEVTSTLDGVSRCKLHVARYGHDLFIGVIFDLRGITGLYKRMAAACFVSEMESLVIDAIALTGKELDIRVAWKRVELLSELL